MKTWLFIFEKSQQASRTNEVMNEQTNKQTNKHVRQQYLLVEAMNELWL